MIFGKRIRAYAAVSMAAVMMAAGCGGRPAEVEVEKPAFRLDNAVAVGEDGSITATLVDTFAEEYYDRGELLVMVSEEASRFNAGSAADTMRAERVTVEDGLVNVVINFSGRGAYAAYNDVIFFVGTLEEALAHGLKLEDDFIGFADAAKTLTPAEVLELKGVSIIVTNAHVNGPLTVEVNGHIVCMSKGVRPWLGRDSVRLAEEAGEFAYVVYRQ